MPVSGVKLPKELEDLYKVMKVSKKEQSTDVKKPSFIVIELAEGLTEWRLKAVGEPFPAGHKYLPKEQFRLLYEQFVNDQLIDQHPVYAIFDFGKLNMSPAKHLNLIGFQWCPDTCGVSKKMIFASSVEGLKKSMSSEQYMVENELDDVGLDKVLMNCAKTTFDKLA